MSLYNVADFDIVLVKNFVKSVILREVLAE